MYRYLYAPFLFCHLLAASLFSRLGSTVDSSSGNQMFCIVAVRPNNLDGMSNQLLTKCSKIVIKLSGIVPQSHRKNWGYYTLVPIVNDTLIFCILLTSYSMVPLRPCKGHLINFLDGNDDC